MLESHWLELVVLAVVTVWAALLVPALVRSASTKGHGLALTALYLTAGTAPAMRLVDPTGASPLVAKVSELGTVIAFSLIVVTILTSVRVRQPLPGSALVLIVYGLVLVAAGIYAGGFNLRWLLLPGLALVVGRGAGMSPQRLVQHLRYAVRITTFGSLVLAVTDYSAVEFADNGRVLFGLPQLAGATDHPNVLGPLAAMALAFEVAPGTRRRSILGITAAVACSVLAQSRAGWLCVAVVLLVWFAARPGRARVLMIGGYLAAVAATAAATWLSVFGRPDFRLTPDVSVLNGRNEVWSLAWGVFRAHPWFGAGPDAFDVQFRATHGQFGAVTGQAHDQVLQTMATVGLVGLVVFIALAWVWGRAAIWCAREGTGVAAATLLALAAHAAVESPLRGYLPPGTFMALAVVALVTTARDESLGDGSSSSSTRLIANYSQ